MMSLATTFTFRQNRAHLSSWLNPGAVRVRVARLAAAHGSLIGKGKKIGSATV